MPTHQGVRAAAGNIDHLLLPVTYTPVVAGRVSLFGDGWACGGADLDGAGLTAKRPALVPHSLTRSADDDEIPATAVVAARR